jgi:hypothetical protein
MHVHDDCLHVILSMNILLGLSGGKLFSFSCVICICITVSLLNTKYSETWLI